MSTLFFGHYLRNRSTSDIGVLGYIGIVQHKEHSPEVLSIPPGTPCISFCFTFINFYFRNVLFPSSISNNNTISFSSEFSSVFLFPPTLPLPSPFFHLFYSFTSFIFNPYFPFLFCNNLVHKFLSLYIISLHIHPFLLP